MTAHRGALASFVPVRLVEFLGDDLGGPASRSAHGAALYADIAGSCELAERLVSLHGGAIDELSRVLNECFTVLIDAITDAGGEIVQFAGDAMLAVWIADEHSVATATRAAAAAAAALNHALAQRTDLAALGISLRTGVGAGQIRALRVGANSDRWEVVATGPAVDDAFRASAAATRGGTTLSPQASALLAAIDRSTATATPALAIAPRPYEHFVPELIRDRMAGGLDGWLAELRHLSVMFVNVHGLCLSDDDATVRLDAATRAVKTALRDNNGYFRQLSIDDKGIVVVAAFGVPPVRRERRVEDPLCAALHIRESFTSVGLTASIGIASGRVFCGVIGSETRREYAMVGNPVNFAARLMMTTRDGIVCDSTTVSDARELADFELLGETPLKGFGIVRPSALQRLRVQAPLPAHSAAQTVGREDDIRDILGLVDALRPDDNRTVVIEGAPGLGKSTFVQAVAAEARRRGIPALAGSAAWTGQSTPYHAWTRVIEDALGIGDIEDHAERLDKVQDALRRDPGLERAGPLLNDFLPLGLDENAFTAGLDGIHRAEEARELVARLLTQFRGDRPLLLILDDAQWCDPASWSVVLKGLPQVRHLLTIIASRPIESAGDDLRALLGQEGIIRRVLEPLGESAIGHACASAAGVRALSAPLVEWLSNRAAGNPFFARQFVLSFMQRGLLEVADGAVVREPAITTLASLSLPASVEALVLTRLDALAPVQQVLLKTASVLGPRFSLADLDALHPIPEQRPQLRGDLEALVVAQLARGDDEGFAFAHQIVLDVAYGTMVGTQRKTTHARVAEYIEHSQADDLAPVYGRLAHHWDAAGVDTPTFMYLELAAADVSRKGAFREAITHLSRALELDATRGHPNPDDRRARWYRELGDAYDGVGEMPAAKTNMLASLSQYGAPMPATETGMLGLLGKSVVRQLVNLAMPPRRLPPDSPAHRRAIDVARASMTISEACFYENLSIGSAASIFVAANACDRVGDCAGAARAYSTLGVVFSMSKAVGLGNRYFRRARATAERAHDISGAIRSDLAEAHMAIWYGDFALADRLLVRATELAQAQGLRREYEMAEGLGANFRLAASRYEEHRDHALQLLAVSTARGQSFGAVWALLALAADHVRFGNLGAAADFVSDIRRHPNLLNQEDVLCDAWDLAIRIRLGEWDAAHVLAERVRRGLGIARAGETPAGKIVVLAHWQTLTCYSEACLAFAERADASSRAGALVDAKRACDEHRRFARNCPIGMPGALTFEGKRLALTGRVARGKRLLRRAAATARQLQMHFERARALQCLAELESPGSTERQQLLSEAEMQFTRLGCALDLESVQRLRAP